MRKAAPGHIGHLHIQHLTQLIQLSAHGGQLSIALRSLRRSSTGSNRLLGAAYRFLRSGRLGSALLTQLHLQIPIIIVAKLLQPQLIELLIGLFPALQGFN